MSKAIPFIVGALQIGAGIITGNPALIWSGGAMIAGASANALLVEKPGRQAQEARMKIGETPRKAILGLAATAGDLADAFNFGGKNGTDNEVLVIDIADHECDALVGYWLNDKYFAFAGDGVQPSVGEGQLEMYWLPGTADQAVPALLTSHGGWSANDRARGCARVIVLYKADGEGEKNPEMPSRPNFLFVVRGAKLYDPRLDDTVEGGEGPHRWDDPATREWSANLKLCDYNYDRGLYACNRVDQPDQLMIGRGLSAAEAPPELIFAAANLCDEDVALAAGGTEKRYHGGGIVYADEDFGTIKEAFAAAMGGQVVQHEGCVLAEPGQAKAPVFEFTDADLVTGTPRRWRDLRSESDKEWVNMVAARYVEPSQKWADHGAPIRRNSADVTADGGQRVASPSLRFVTSGTHAQRVAEIRRRMGRLKGSGEVTLGPRFAEIEEGDWGTWTSQRFFGGATRTVRVESFNLPENWQNTLTLREIAASCYAWSSADEIADGATAESVTPPDRYTAPDEDAWAIEALEDGGVAAGALRFTGACDDRYATAVLFEYRLFDPGNGPDDNWVGPAVSSVMVSEQVITGLLAGTEYEGAVSYQYGGIVGDRLILDAVTTPENEIVYDGGSL